VKVGSKKPALVIAPGRGTYNAAELGYLARWHADKADFLAMADAYRAGEGQPTLTELDSAEGWRASIHARGDNASALIFACSYLDFLAIDRQRFEIVAVTGNSMGWYTALGCGGALAAQPALTLTNTMGRYMQEASIGGQAIWSLVDEDWRPIPGRREALTGLIAAIHGHDGAELHVSIELGGMLVLAGNQKGLEVMTARAPKGPGRFPLGLPGHAGFHSVMQAPVSERAKATISPAVFGQPAIPMIDGAGRIWRPRMTDVAALRDYTLGEQVVETYDFTTAVQVGVKEFAPEAVIVLGPGETLGGAVAQSLIAVDWLGMASKADFTRRQSENPFLLAMGREDQRKLVVQS
jgi:acyl transferase domain-containing protein